MKKLLAAVLLLCTGCTGYSQVKYNGGFEMLNANHTAVGWLVSFQPEQLKAYPVKVDSLEKQEGKYALSIEKVNDESDFGVIDFPIVKVFKGDKIQLRGFIKTQNVTSGYAGLWLRIDGTPAFDNMQARGIKGTTDWTEYVVDLPYDDEKATSIHGGALLVGRGKIWVDNFRLFINGEPIENAAIKVKKLSGPERDTAFAGGSKIDTVVMSKQQLVNLTALGQVWGFLKYHHPAIAKGKYNWDAELFRVMPFVLKAANDMQLSTAIETWVDKLGVPSVCKNCTVKANEADITLKPDYGMLFNNKVLSTSLTAKLAYIRDNHNTGDNYYIDMVGRVGNPVFQHEGAYSEFAYPDAGYRLLCLYRYWSMINYFFPYKHLIGENWNDVLADCIPKFISSANATEYSLNALALIARIHDTHANIWGLNRALNNYKGRFGVPFQAKFIEDKLVVTGYYNDTLNVKQLVKPGDVITSINGLPVADLVKKYLPYTAASNYETQLRDLPKSFLLRGNGNNLKLGLVRDGNASSITIASVPIAKIKYAMDSNPEPNAPGYYLMNDGQIGYVFPGRYKNKNMPEIEKLFAKTRGIIIDMRCYPSDFMPFTFVPYIKSGDAPFVKFSRGDVANPGLFVQNETISSPAYNKYKGKVVVIVNEQSQSQAEYTTMAFQSSPNVTVIGSTTAGADGNVSPIVLPGNIATMISGLGVYYPDGTDTQRKGVKINEVVKPTIKGVKEGRDELLERAKDILLRP